MRLVKADFYGTPTYFVIFEEEGIFKARNVKGGWLSEAEGTTESELLHDLCQTEEVTIVPM